jgi:FAD/FMN-containing dehydrogenase
MSEKELVHRRRFLQLIAAGAAGLVFAGCGPDIKEVPGEKKTTAKKDSIPAPIEDKKPLTENVKYYRKGDPEYEELRHGHNKRFDKFPAVIALCLNTDGVSEAIKYAKENKLPVAIKSGGHSLEGFSVNDGGMVINLSKLNTIALSEEEDTVKLGPACTLAQLYADLIPKGRMIPGGSCGGVAIGGLSLGGGYGMFSRRMGLTCDNLLEFTMVDGKGKIVYSKDDPELLWACKGGGAGNFGVVTEMKFKTHDAPKTLTSHRFRKFKTDAQSAAGLLEKWFGLTAALPSSCFSVFVQNGKTSFILFTNFEKETTEVKNLIDEFSALTEKTSLGKAQVLDSAVQTFYGIQTPVFAKNSSVGLYKSFDEIQSFIVPVFEKLMSTSGMLLSIGTLGGAIDNPEYEKASAFPHRGFHYLSELQTYWKTEEQGKRLITAYKEVRDIFQDNGVSREYINYPDLGFRNWEKAYYGDNYERLQQVKLKYDPDNTIRHEQSVRTGPQTA